MEDESNVREATLALTAREKAIAALICEGLSRKEIAEQLYISHHTVHEHERHIFRKLGCHGRAKAVTILMRSKIAPPSEN